MRRFSRLILAVGLLVAGGGLWLSSVRAAEKAAFTDLLAGGDLSKNWITTGNWTLDKQGVATLTPRPGEKGWQRYDAYLTSKEKYENFEIEFEYMVQKSGNSGFYFHIGDVKNPVATGIEVQIYDSHGKDATKPLTDHDSGGIIPGIPPTKNTAKAAGEWNKFQITVQGPKLLVKLNGELVNDVDLTQDKLKSRPKTGAISFQDHGLPLALRNIKIRAL